MVGVKLDALCDELGVAPKRKKRNEKTIATTDEVEDDPFFFNKYPLEDDEMLKSLNEMLKTSKQRKIWVTKFHQTLFKMFL
jgi:hypothetical protein